jgi:O-antigen/teichoic acid export membrane protein
MFTNRDIFWSFSLQGLAGAATLLTSLVISLKYGAVGLGAWSDYISFINLLAVIVAFGLPNMVPFLMTNYSLDHYKILKSLTLYFCIVYFVLVVGLYFCKRFDAIVPKHFFSLSSVSIITITIVAIAFQSVFRGIILISQTKILFNITCLLPPAILLCLIVLWPDFEVGQFPTLILTASSLALATCFFLLPNARNNINPLVIKKLTSKKLAYIFINQSGGNLALAILAMLLPVMTFNRLNGDEQAQVNIGCFSIAILMQSLAITPANILGPFLYREWLQKNSSAELLKFYSRLLKIVTVISIAITIIFLVLLGHIFEYVLSPEFTNGLMPSLYLICAVPFCYMTRVGGNVLLARGFAANYALAAAGRPITLILFSLTSGVDSLELMAIAWLIGEILTLVLILATVSTKMNWPIMASFGFRKNEVH